MATHELNARRSMEPGSIATLKPDTVDWTHERLFHSGDEYFADLARAIDSAQTSIELETYIFDHDRLGRRLLERLSHAANRGIRVRLLLDGVGCSRWSYANASFYMQAGSEIRFYHPLPWQNTQPLSIWRHLTLRRWALGFWKLNRRNHRKTCIIDGKTAYLGGMNITSRHLESVSGTDAWRDTSLRISGNGVSMIQDAFEQAWRHPGSSTERWKKHRSPSARSALVKINTDRRQRLDNYCELVRRVAEAKSRIWVTCPYFVPDRALVRALRLSAWSGVDVRLLLPYRSDVLGIQWANRAHYDRLLRSGVRIYEYHPRILHAKTLLIDDWAQVGSSNLNHRSLIHDLELDVVLKDPESVHDLERQFQKDMKSSKRVTIQTWRKRPLRDYVLEKAALSLRHWL
jgi:cardiolipin synthase A/B